MERLTGCFEWLESLVEWLKGAMYAMCLYLGVKTGSVEILILLMGIDSLLGIIKALRLGRSFSFKVLGWGIISKFCVLIFPLTVALLGKGVDMDLGVTVVIVMNLLIANEGISIITNILSIKTKKEIKNDDYVTIGLNAVRELLKSLAEKILTLVKK